MRVTFAPFGSCASAKRSPVVMLNVLRWFVSSTYQMRVPSLALAFTWIPVERKYVAAHRSRAPAGTGPVARTGSATDTGALGVALGVGVADGEAVGATVGSGV